LSSIRPTEAELLASLPDDAREIRLARLSAGIAQTAVANRCDFAQPYLSNLETGRFGFSEAQKARILAAIANLAGER
jgi:predicted transcriptional regulator